MSSSMPKATIIGELDGWPRIMFDSDEFPHQFQVTGIGAEFGETYIDIRIPVREVSIRPND